MKHICILVGFIFCNYTQVFAMSTITREVLHSLNSSECTFSHSLQDLDNDTARANTPHLEATMKRQGYVATDPKKGPAKFRLIVRGTQYPQLFPDGKTTNVSIKLLSGTEVVSDVGFSGGSFSSLMRVVGDVIQKLPSCREVNEKLAKEVPQQASGQAPLAQPVLDEGLE